MIPDIDFFTDKIRDEDPEFFSTYQDPAQLKKKPEPDPTPDQT